MNGFEKPIKDILRENGWTFIRQGKGSHEIWSNGSRQTTIPKGCKSRALANDIMKQSGIDHKFK
jgi:predicted RNA binding protein YcfA (HicA-like mRNA interferase family)